MQSKRPTHGGYSAPEPPKNPLNFKQAHDKKGRPLEAFDLSEKAEELLREVTDPKRIVRNPRLFDAAKVRAENYASYVEKKVSRNNEYIDYWLGRKIGDFIPDKKRETIQKLYKCAEINASLLREMRKRIAFMEKLFSEDVFGGEEYMYRLKFRMSALEKIAKACHKELKQQFPRK
ncbi:MAG TPA: hypothetical protein VFF13_06665 [archaeon]|nr:hypothetical protein [archaeon]